MTQESDDKGPNTGSDSVAEPTGFAAVKAKWKQEATKFSGGSGLTPRQSPAANSSSSNTTTATALSNSSSHHSRNSSSGSGGIGAATLTPTTEDASTSLPVRHFGRRASLSAVPSSTGSAEESTSTAAVAPTTATTGTTATTPSRMSGGFHLNRTRVTTTVTTTITTGGKSTVQTNSTHTWRTRPRFSGTATTTATTTNAADTTATAGGGGANINHEPIEEGCSSPSKPNGAINSHSSKGDDEPPVPLLSRSGDPQPQPYKVPNTPVRDWRATSTTAAATAALSLNTPRSSHTPRGSSWIVGSGSSSNNTNTNVTPGSNLARNKSADAIPSSTMTTHIGTTEESLQMMPNLNKEPATPTPSTPRKIVKSKSKDNLESVTTTPRKTAKSKSSRESTSTPIATTATTTILGSTDRSKSTSDLPVPTPYRVPGGNDVVSTKETLQQSLPVPTPYRTHSSTSTDCRMEDMVKTPSNTRPNAPLRRSTKKSHAAASRIKQAVIYTAPKVADFPVFQKSDRDSEVVWEALYKNELFSSLRMGQLNQLVSAFEPCSFAAGDIIVNEGDVSNPKEMHYFYIIDRGAVEFTMDDDKHIGMAEDRASFGELSLLYAAPRACTVMALEDARLFRCDRVTFCTILSREMQRCVHLKGRIVDGVQFLANASTGTSDVRDYMSPRTVRKGEVLVEQGSISEKFFVVAEGEIRCRTIMTGVGSSLAETRASLKPGEYFGERNLVSSPLELSQSTYVAATDGLVFSIDRTTFMGLVGKANFETSAMAILNDANIRRLEDVLFLQNLSATDLVKLATLLKDKAFKYGDSILTEKENTKASLFIVKSGSLSMSSSENFDRKVLKAGSCFGEAHMQRAHSKGKKTIKSLYTVTARMDCVCSILTMKDYWSVVGAPENAKTPDGPDPPPPVQVATGIPSVQPTSSEPEQSITEISEPRPVVAEASTRATADEAARVREVEPKGLRLSEPRSLAVQAEAVQLEKASPKEAKVEKTEESIASKLPATANDVTHTVEPKTRVETKAKGENGLVETIHSTDTSHRRRSLIRQSSSLQLEPLNVKLDKLKKHCVLGEGTFGVVWLVSDPSKQSDNFYALKKQSKAFLLSENQVEAVIQEKIMLENMKHPFLICLFATFQDEMFVYMLLDFVQGGELFTLMHEQDPPVLPESQAKFYALCLADVLAYLHKSKYVYRDLKPENVMLDGKGFVKLIDFGFCKYLVAEKTYTLVGTPGYLSPETVSVQGHSFSSDNWSLGILIFEMIVGSSPFYYEDIDQMELFESIVNDPVKLPDTLSREVSDIILKLLTKEPTERLGSAHLLDIIEHPWFAELDLDAMRHRDVTAPWVPDVQGPTDTCYFDDWSELEQANDVDDGNHNGDISKKGQALSKRDQKLFEGAF